MSEPFLGETVNVPATETPIADPGWSLGSNSGSGHTSPSRGPITTNGAILPAAIREAPAPARRARATDEQLARAAGQGDAAAFEALYERHHRPLLSFARHMVGGVHDAEDVVQHAFLAADSEFRSGKVPKAVRAWLYTVARNRCVSLLRARREEPGLPDAGMPAIENLAADVEQREDLRNLLADLRALPDDQRAALLLSELGDLSHPEVAKVIGVRPGKVKALVFQARETLMAAAHARAIPCRSIQEELAVATGASLRRRHLRNHLAQCSGCREYADRVRAQRASLALVLPVVPTIALRDTVLSGLGVGATATAGAGATAGGVGLLAAKSTAAKLLAIAAVGGAAAGGGTVAITTHDASTGDRSSERREQRAPAAAAPAAAPVALDEATRSAGDPRTASSRRRTAARRHDRPAKRAAHPERAKVTPPPDTAQANGHREKPATERTPPGQAKPKPAHEPRAHAKPHGGPAKVKPPRASTPKHVPAKSSKPKPSPKPVEPPAAEPAPPTKPELPGEARGLQNEQSGAGAAAAG
jgi:RNA polymerase sigma factor (sigma-70 family)